MSDTQIQIVLKAWEKYQDLIKGFGENCWKIRSVFYTVAFGLMAAAFSSDVASLYLLVVLLSPLFLFMETGYRRLQDQYIRKSIEIETTINDILVEDPKPRIPNGGIGTSLDTPRLRDFVALFRLRRYLLWISYLVMLGLALVLFMLDITKSRMTLP